MTDHCTECNDRGVLVQLGGDWGRRQDTVVPCWACHPEAYPPTEDSQPEEPKTKTLELELCKFLAKGAITDAQISAEQGKWSDARQALLRASKLVQTIDMVVNYGHKPA